MVRLNKTGYAEVNGARLYYEEGGTGEPLLLLHAGVADSRMWDAQFGEFAQGFRTIRFDLRGFGMSQMSSGEFCNYEDVAGLLDALQIEASQPSAPNSVPTLPKDVFVRVRDEKEKEKEEEKVQGQYWCHRRGQRLDDGNGNVV